MSDESDIDAWLNSMPLVADTVDPESDAYQALLSIAEETPPSERVQSFKESGNLAYVLGTKGAEAAATMEEKKLRERGIDPHAPVPSGIGPDTKPAPLTAESASTAKATTVKKSDDRHDIGRERLGRQRVRDAIAYYTQALDVKYDDNEVNSTIHCNRGMAHYALGNYGHCVRDCMTATKLNANNVKAYYHAARACIKLSKFEFAKKFVEDALNLSSISAKFRRVLEKQLLQVTECIATAIEKEAKVQRRHDAKNEEHGGLLDELAMRGVSVVRLARNDELPGEARLYSDDVGVFHYPVLIMYPHYRTSDLIRDMQEDHCVHDHLSAMLPPIQSYAEWDTKDEYTVTNVNVYVEVGKDRSGHDKMALVDPKLPLHSILLTPGFAIDGIPTLYVVAKSGEYFAKFLQQHRVVSS